MRGYVTWSFVKLHIWRPTKSPAVDYINDSESVICEIHL